VEPTVKTRNALRGTSMNTLTYAKSSGYTLSQSDLSGNVIYPVQFYMAAFDSMFGKHDLKLDKLHRYISTFHITEERC
jgi:hypothetical protein